MGSEHVHVTLAVSGISFFFVSCSFRKRRPNTTHCSDSLISAWNKEYYGGYSPHEPISALTMLKYT